MDKAGTAGMAIVPTFDEFTPAAVERGTSRTLATAGARGGKVFGDRAGKSVGTSFLSHIKRVAALGSGLLVGAAVKNFVGDSIAEARESQKVGALTVSTLRATGHEAGITNKQIGQLAHTLSHKAAIDDEQIQAGENVLLSYKSVHNEVGKGNDIFSKATARAVDLAAALAGQKGGTPDVAAASKIVGKALDDPVKGMSALRKAGVDFSAQQIANVKNLVATGKTMDAQKVILGALADRYKGAAASQATEGAKVGVAWKNVEEQVGNAILPLIDDIEQAILTKGMPTIRHWANEFRYDGIPAIKDFADVVEKKGLPVLKKLYDKGKPLAEAIFPALGTALGDTASALTTAAPYAERLVKAFNDMPGWAQKVIVAGGAGLAIGQKTGALGALLKLATGGKGGVLAGVTKASPLPVLVVNEGFGVPGGGKGGLVADGEKVAAGAAGASTGAIAAVAALDIVAVGGGAYLIGKYLGSRQPKDDPAKDAAYNKRLANNGPGNGGLQIESFDPLTGLPSIRLVPQISKQVDVLAGKAGAVKLRLNGYDDTMRQLIHLRQVIAQPVTLPINPVVGTIQTPSGDILDQHVNPATVGRAAGTGGNHFHGDIHVHGDTTGRVMADIQRRAQQQLDGVRSTR